MDLKEIFGSEKISFEEFTKKLNGVELVDKKDYVHKDKYDAQTTASKDWKKKYDELSKSVDGDEGFKTKLEQLEKDLADRDTKIQEFEKEKTNNERLSILSKNGLDDKFSKFALSEIGSMVDEKTDFNKALESWKKDNTQFFKEEKSGFSFNQPTGVNRSVSDDKGSPKNEMNTMLKNALFKKAVL